MPAYHLLLDYREEQLLHATTQPLTRSLAPGENKVVYPHVYDSMATAKQTAAFIGGSKVSCNHWRQPNADHKYLPKVGVSQKQTYVIVLGAECWSSIEHIERYSNTFFQLALPATFSKTSTKVFEEVTIPPTEQAPTSIGGQRVPIASLDMVRLHTLRFLDCRKRDGFFSY